MIRITVNGKPTEVDRPMSIDELIKSVEVPKNYLAVEVNEDVVPREQHGEYVVNEGDRVEVVTLVGGG
ncbi:MULTISPECIES: sulfur carrier protein ThiS [Pirellulaceae]|uniref:Sulfur carrier protein n=1 Tax=Aporhodopirellula rubra TaxID=980271 RepID=A0A7W5E0F9_9BACT|nr:MULTISPECIES: sulfur carrier protein ThiS [Pirellulaceae]EMI46052.1 ThiS, thiamine-biosynthesis [Rhodopirellula sp. SWK7]MBB3207896.1 sulfur carrier protein [Aporhodopirellula rubra]